MEVDQKAWDVSAFSAHPSGWGGVRLNEESVYCMSRWLANLGEGLSSGAASGRSHLEEGAMPDSFCTTVNICSTLTWDPCHSHGSKVSGFLTCRAHSSNTH